MWKDSRVLEQLQTVLYRHQNKNCHGLESDERFEQHLEKLKHQERDQNEMALYGCEAWTLMSAEEKQLLVFEMAALRKILGVRIIDKMRNDDSRKALNQTEAIMKNGHSRQHQWFGHVLRMDKNRIASITVHGRVEYV